MNYRSILILLLTTILTIPTLSAESQSEIDLLMGRLDSVIANKDTYSHIKEKRIADLREQLSNAKDDHQRVDLLREMFDEYLSYNTDSAYNINIRQLELARRLKDKNLLLSVHLNRANIYSNTGMYHETLLLIDSIKRTELPDYLLPYYYHTMRTVYGRLTDYATFQPEKAHYEKLTDVYRDSLLLANKDNKFIYTLIKADHLNVHGNPHEAIKILQAYINNNNLSEHDQAIFAWSLSEAYGKINDYTNQKKYLLISSISDIKSAVREYVSLRQLALMLYKEGDLDRAYKFLSIAVSDASKCNARQRIIELNESYPMIDQIYVEKISEQKKTLEHTVITIIVLLVILLILLIFMRKQMIKIANERLKVQQANNKLNELNEQLKDSNNKLNSIVQQLNESNDKLNILNCRLQQSNLDLKQANCAISEISELKEVYIGKYMEQSLAYIEMLDNYRKSIGKLLTNDKIDELKKKIKSSSMIDDEFKAFYAQFDKTFLNLFPSFVHDLNNLLLPEEAIIPRKPGQLNSELRVYALIRLGVTDSDKIARFLRFSLTTIYNYRTKVRNKARGDRNQLEAEVAKIGQQTRS